jgi:hypothetical protein
MQLTLHVRFGGGPSEKDPPQAPRRRPTQPHAGSCERRRVRFPPPTLLVVLVHGTRADVEALREDVATVWRRWVFGCR